MSKKEKIQELQWTIGAYEDEVEENKELIASLIKDNDRLTLAFEPYIPEDHEDYGLTFYGLKEENDQFAQNILDKIEVIKELDNENYNLRAQIRQLQKKTSEKRSYAGSVSFDFWPPSDWFRLNLSKFSSGRYFQAMIGPIRLDFYED